MLVNMACSHKHWPQLTRLKASAQDTGLAAFALRGLELKLSLKN